MSKPTRGPDACNRFRPNRTLMTRQGVVSGQSVALAAALIVATALSSLGQAGGSGDDPIVEKREVDATTLHHKVLCGYQGWFRCPDDPARVGWRHWSRDGKKISPSSLTFEMWPDLAEYGEDEKYPAPGFTYPDGKPAHLFSSANPKTVDRHFQWMKQYGIDGVILQRFLADLRDRSIDQVLANVQRAANRNGRIFAIGYDLSGMPAAKVYDTLVADWKRLVDDVKLTQEDRYLFHNRKPVVMVWGFYRDRFGPELANRIIDFFKNDPTYGATLIGGCQWHWRTEKDPEWAKALRRFDVVSPWNVGNVNTVRGEKGPEKHASTGYWKDDLAEAKRTGMAYLPVVYPGFGWTNLKGKTAASATIPRLGGEFFWRQFAVAADLGMEMAYVAMFDEVDEGTAIFKVSNTPPTQPHFDTYDGLPTDWYLRLTGEASKVIRGEAKATKTLPITP